MTDVNHSKEQGVTFSNDKPDESMLIQDEMQLKDDQVIEQEGGSFILSNAQPKGFTNSSDQD
jgi:hypothetical protein